MPKPGTPPRRLKRLASAALLLMAAGDPARGLDVVTRHVTDREHDTAVGLHERVVPVTADRVPGLRRQVTGVQLDARDVRQVGQHAVLQHLGHVALPAVQAAVVDRQPGPPADLDRGPLLVGAVVALTAQMLYYFMVHWRARQVVAVLDIIAIERGRAPLGPQPRKP